MTPANQQYDLSKTYQADNICRAEHHHLVRIARSRHSRQSSRLAQVYKASLFSVGKRLESIGMMMQIRYGDLKPMTIPSSDSDSHPGMAC